MTEAAHELNVLTEAVGSAKQQVEFDRLVAKYEKIIEGLPQNLQDMTEEELILIDGGEEYLKAIKWFDEVYVAKNRFFTFADYAEPEYQNGSAEESNHESDAIMNEILDDPYAEAEDDYILKPGVTYITMSSGTGTDELGGKVSLNMEFTIYKDGTVTGNLIETNSKDSYGNNNSYEHPIEGTWVETSKHDKRFLKIDLVLESEDYYNEFTYYIDESLKAYANDVNTRPVQLREK